VLEYKARNLSIAPPQGIQMLAQDRLHVRLGKLMWMCATRQLELVESEMWKKE
jgi:hypothetical protein